MAFHFPHFSLSARFTFLPMNRTYWQHLQVIAPQALNACTARFAKKYPDDWRRRIQHLDHLEQYFYEMHKIELHHARTAGGAQPFGYRISGWQYRVTRNRSFTSADEARWAALAMAFSLVELEERRVPFVRPEIHQPVRRQPKDEKKSLAQEDWRPPIPQGGEAGRGLRASSMK